MPGLSGPDASPAPVPRALLAGGGGAAQPLVASGRSASCRQYHQLCHILPPSPRSPCSSSSAAEATSEEIHYCAVRVRTGGGYLHNPQLKVQFTFALYSGKYVRARSYWRCGSYIYRPRLP